MKKIITILIATLFLSCTPEDKNIISYQELLPIISAQVPEEVTIDSKIDIFITYNKPTSCHFYNDIYYINGATENTMAVISTYSSVDDYCTTVNEEIETSFKFKAEHLGEHSLKFWQGKDSNNQDIYLTHTIEIVP